MTRRLLVGVVVAIAALAAFAATPASVPVVFDSSDLFLMFTVLPEMNTLPVPFSVSDPMPKLG